jgi:hypothetical protein
MTNSDTHNYANDTEFLPLFHWASQMSPDVQADAGFLRDKAAVLREAIK